MNWEETIQFIRTKPEFKNLVKNAYFEEELPLNVQRFENSAEFLETLKLIRENAPNAKTILDIGCGNGISAIAFARKGYKVTAVEPDPSDTIGAGAVRKLKEHYKLDNIEIFEAFGEDLNLPPESFDIFYARQCMHHANDLNGFVKEGVDVLKRNGLFLTIRDHVIYDDKDKELFFEKHALHKFYGGENAFKEEEYIAALEGAGLEIKSMLRYYDSIINFSPISINQLENKLNKIVDKELGLMSRIPLLRGIYKSYNGLKWSNAFKEEDVAGRMYTFIAHKK